MFVWVLMGCLTISTADAQGGAKAPVAAEGEEVLAEEVAETEAEAEAEDQEESAQESESPSEEPTPPGGPIVAVEPTAPSPEPVTPVDEPPTDEPTGQVPDSPSDPEPPPEEPDPKPVVPVAPIVEPEPQPATESERFWSPPNTLLGWGLSLNFGGGGNHSLATGDGGIWGIGGGAELLIGKHWAVGGYFRRGKGGSNQNATDLLNTINPSQPTSLLIVRTAYRQWSIGGHYLFNPGGILEVSTFLRFGRSTSTVNQDSTDFLNTISPSQPTSLVFISGRGRGALWGLLLERPIVRGLNMRVTLTLLRVAKVKGLTSTTDLLNTIDQSSPTSVILTEPGRVNATPSASVELRFAF